MNCFNKSICILFTISLLSLNLFAQYGTQFENRGFENWTTRQETADPEPVHWHSGGTATGWLSSSMPHTMSQSSETRPGSSGSKSVHLVPKSVLGVTANGSFTNGRMNAGSMSASGTSNYNYTQRSQSLYNTPITMIPDSVAVWICFRSQSSTDKGFVDAVVHGDTDYQIIANGTESPTNMRVARAYVEFTRTSTNGGAYNWRRLSIPFVAGASNDPRYILFVATTNKTAGEGSTNDDLFVDDVLLIYNPTLSMGNLATHSFQPNDAITIPFTLTGTMSPDNLNAAANVVIAQMSNASGSFSNPTELGRVTTNTSGSITAQIPAVANGNYQIRVISTNYPMVGTNSQQVTITNPTYTIAASANPSAGGTVTGGGTYTQGSSCTVAATANSGYTFNKWTENGSQVSTNANYTFTVTSNRTLVANFAVNTYNITATANPAAGGTVTGGGSYQQGQSCTLTATANTGYTFTNWTENGSVVSSDASYTFNVTSNRTLVANFAVNTYTIAASANPSEGGTVSGTGEYDYGTSCTLSATATTGYTFANWTENGEVVSTNASYTFTVSGSRTLVANFSLNTYNVMATCNPAAGGTVSGAGEYNHGESCTLTATAATGYTFANWSENGSTVSTNASYTFNVTGNRTLVANFTINSYEITAAANPSAGGSVTGAGEFDYGTSCTLTATAATGYTFSNWTENGDVVSSNYHYTFTVTGDRSLVANFTLNTYSITVTANPSIGGNVSGAGEYNHGESCTLTATASTGYTFVKWIKNGTQVSTDPSYTFTVTEAGEYVAHFSLISYPITATADPSAGGTVNGAGNYNHGASCTLTAMANTGYSFVNWTKNGIQVSTDASYTFTVIESADFVAHFNLNSYNITVTANPTDGGTVDGDGIFNYGESCSVTATASMGYTFTNWTENGIEVSTNANYTFTVNGDRNLVANFSAISYTIEVSANPSNSGTATGGGTYSYGQSCTVIATSAEGYIFSNWTENGSVVSTDANYTFIVDGDRSLVANFEELAPDTYSINVSPNPNVGGTVTGGGSYQQDQQCTVTATANAGYTFLEWTENGDQVSTDASYTFVVTGNRTLVAQFQIQSYTINATVNPSNSGTVTGDGSFEFGQTCTLVAIANTGYTFTNWTENDDVVSTSSNYSFTVNSNRNLVANFSLNSYYITASADPSVGGAISGSGNYNHGDSCTLTATSNQGYAFVNWTKDGTEVSTDASYTFTVTETATFVAHFQWQAYTITAIVEPEEGGTVTGAGGYDYGASCTLTATPNEGYAFVNWTKDGTEVSTNASYTFAVSETATYVAHFQWQICTITAIVVPEEGGTVTGAGEYDYGATCTLTAIPNENYVFFRWTKNGEEVSTDSIFTFTVTETATYEVYFQYFDNVEENTIASQIFPNPFNSTVSIKAEKVIKTVIVYDLNGRVVKEQGVSDTNVDLDLSDLSMGSYLLQLDYGNSKTIHRIVKAK